MRLLRREPGRIGIADLLMVVLIADASQNAMAGDYDSIFDGLILVLTVNAAIMKVALETRSAVIVERHD